ncbi:hypothetical protein FOXYS1_10942 [Fusarium oxysporum]|uniref:Zn(2)-C6 fungal-type domain-containing protein n=1 Tax=Fusarium oxysporum TaxID=5507 RepID=A0A8H5A4P1_FUSOX|nr:hypothetical protein FOXYS1_10942 [Fusarium oxysporum]
MSVPGATSATEPDKLSVWSCFTCKRRKVRCDRRNPCSACVRRGGQCVFPTSGRPPRHLDSAMDDGQAGLRRDDLLGRIRRLEGLIRSYGAHFDQEVRGADVVLAGSVVEDQGRGLVAEPFDDGGNDDDDSGRSPVGREASEVGQGQAGTNRSPDEEPGVLVSDDKGKLYVSGEFWSTLRQEVSAPRNTSPHGHENANKDGHRKARLVREAFEDEDDRQSGTYADSAYRPSLESPTRNNVSENTSFLFRSFLGSSSYDDIATTQLYPLPSQMLFIWQNYIDNVDPFLKVLHIPTTTNVLKECKGHFRSLSPAMEALFICTAYAAIMSLTEYEVSLNFASDKPSLASRYRAGAERSLAAADFINTSELATVQALTIFLSVLQCEESTRYIWTLTGLLSRIAFSLGLHRDGSEFQNMAPFEVELRRRLWWHICFLDSRTGDGRVHAALISEQIFNTEPPTNVDDKDMYPEMTDPVVGRQGPTDASICLVRCRTWRLARTVACPVPQDTAPPNSSDSRHQAYESRLEAIRNFKNGIRADIPTLDTEESDQISCLRSITSMVADRFQLMLTYQRALAEGIDPFTFKESFSLAMSLLSQMGYLRNNSAMSRWAWLTRGYVPWQALAIVLSYICTSPWDAESEKAWTSVRQTLDEMPEAIRHEPLWQPFHKLLSKASSCRMSQTKGHDPSSPSRDLDDRMPIQFVEDTLQLEPPTPLTAVGTQRSRTVKSGQEPTGVPTSPSQRAAAQSAWPSSYSTSPFPGNQPTTGVVPNLVNMPSGHVGDPSQPSTTAFQGAPWPVSRPVVGEVANISPQYDSSWQDWNKWILDQAQWL